MSKSIYDVGTDVDVCLSNQNSNKIHDVESGHSKPQCASASKSFFDVEVYVSRFTYFAGPWTCVIDEACSTCRSHESMG